MNHTEANDILTELKVMFPDWTFWVRSLENRDATLRVWIKSLMSCDKHHILDILDEYTSGKRKAPTSYEYERLIFNIVAAAREMRNVDYAKDNQSKTLKTWREEQDEAKKRRESYKSLQDRNMKVAALQHAQNVETVITQTGRVRSQWTDSDRAMYDEMANQVVERFKKREV